MREEIFLRSAVPADLEQLLPLVRDAWDLHHQHQPDSFPPFDLTSNRLLLRAAMDRTDALLLTAWQGETPVGFAHLNLRQLFLSETPRRVVSVESLYVLPSYRGKGVGQALMERTKEWSIQMGAASIELTVWAFNEQARHFYDRMGLRPRYTAMELPLQPGKEKD